MRVHFIAIGGSIMHNLAIALYKLGHTVTGSDDIIYDPAKSRLAALGLLPDKIGWEENRIHESLDLIILGMHAHPDNPELIKAQDLGLKIQSFPEFLGEHSLGQKTIVVCGSHGKTTTTSMIMHMLREKGFDFDYAVGAQLHGFEDMVKVSDAPIMVIEGDEYLSSPLDARPKFVHYHADIAILTGIAWDHINVFPTFEDYFNAFRQLMQSMSKASILIYNERDTEVLKLVEENHSLETTSFAQLPFTREGIDFHISCDDQIIRLPLFGEYNYRNLMAAIKALSFLNVPTLEWLKSMRSFKMPDKRMNIVRDDGQTKVIRDYAHAPSKVRACLKAFLSMKNDNVYSLAVLEIHTYSSLNINFLPEYSDIFDQVDMPILFYNPKNLEIKRLPEMTPDDIRSAFNCPHLEIFTDSKLLQNRLTGVDHTNTDILLMSSSNFGGINIENL